ncbi:polysaccharide pyruvyl transferase family protein [Microbacterium sp. NEAU-LLC]|uniref:Polysaccharide pyruvyl transferase family protein n=2 Tax=Microbacterium helvum TaxID=2773713 RepID=A0ABR8NQ36_9MICO|nr:polysaccharide pyruvyl transferase family protein [Microbacterium helvum]
MAGQTSGYDDGGALLASHPVGAERVEHHTREAEAQPARARRGAFFTKRKKAPFAPAPESIAESDAELKRLLRPRIGLAGSFTHGNYGDELYVRVYEHWLGQWSDLTLLTGLNRPRYFGDIRQKQVDVMDAVVIGGGDLICPYRPRINPDFINPMYLRRPVHVAGIGVELNRSDIDPRVVRRWREFLRHRSIRSVSARDDRSAEWIKKHIRGRRLVSTHPDLVCALPLPPVTRPEGAPILGLVTRHIKHPKEYALMAEVSRLLLAQGWRVRHIIGGVGNHGQKDLENSRLLEVDGKETFHSEDLGDITRALGECSLVLSMKLHTTLVATMYGVPTVCVNPVAKARSFMQSIGREDLVLAPDDRRLIEIVERGVPAVPMDRVEELRAAAIDQLRSLSQQIWDDYRSESPARERLLPRTVPVR